MTHVFAPRVAWSRQPLIRSLSQRAAVAGAVGGGTDMPTWQGSECHGGSVISGRDLCLSWQRLAGPHPQEKQGLPHE